MKINVSTSLLSPHVFTPCQVPGGHTEPSSFKRLKVNKKISVV